MVCLKFLTFGFDLNCQSILRGSPFQVKLVVRLALYSKMAEYHGPILLSFGLRILYVAI